MFEGWNCCCKLWFVLVKFPQWLLVFLCLHHCYNVSGCIFFRLSDPCVGVWSYIEFLKHSILINCLWEFQMYNFNAFGDKDELIRFWGEKVKGQDYSKTTNGLISTLRHFLSCLQNAWMYFNAAFHNYSIPGPHDTDIFKVIDSWVQRSRPQITFSENAFSWQTGGGYQRPAILMSEIRGMLHCWCPLCNEILKQIRKVVSIYGSWLWHYRVYKNWCVK